MPIPHGFNWEGSGSVVECLARDQGAVGLSLTSITDCDPKQDTLTLS